jgi:hypothetical protein
MSEPSRLITNSEKARQLSVTTRTLRAWEASGVLPPARLINGRRYHEADAMPKPNGRRIDGGIGRRAAKRAKSAA